MANRLTEDNDGLTMIFNLGVAYPVSILDNLRPEQFITLLKNMFIFVRKISYVKNLLLYLWGECGIFHNARDTWHPYYW